MNEELEPIKSGVLLTSYFGSFIFVGVMVLVFYNLQNIRKAFNK